MIVSSLRTGICCDCFLRVSEVMDAKLRIYTTVLVVWFYCRVLCREGYGCEVADIRSVSILLVCDSAFWWVLIVLGVTF